MMQHGGTDEYDTEPSVNETVNAFHASSVNEVLQQLEVDPRQGLSAEDVAERRQRYGENRLREARRRPAWRILLDQFKSVVILLLTVAAVGAFATARWLEGFALVAVTVINTLIGFLSEWKAVRSMEALRAMSQHGAQVRRDAATTEIAPEALVPGDLILLASEQLVPADARLLQGQGLRINEAALTGESVPVAKRSEAVSEEAPLAERPCMLYKGTSVAEGSGEAVVVATGVETELGRIAELAAQAEGQATPLQRRLNQLGRRLAWITIAIAVAVAGSGLLAGRDPVPMIETSLALGVAAIPEGLPIVATIALARGMWLMARQNVLVNRLTAVETLGATRVILTDKTGTLTENRMAVRRVITPLADHALNPDEVTPETRNADGELSDQQDPVLRRIIEIGVLCSNAALGRDGDGSSRGDPTEVALLEVGRAWNLDRDELLKAMPEQREVSFDPDVMMMATFHQEANGTFVAVKGSPEAVLNASLRIAVGPEDRELSDRERQWWREKAEALASEGLRLLAMADKQPDQPEDEPFHGLRFLGLVGLLDPPRQGVREAIEECQRAGIRVVMVTGDRADTGQAIGEQVGLASDGGSVHGTDLGDWEQLSEQRLQRLIGTAIFARVTPHQKLDLVKLFQARGETVAMTGDGVNDAPALKQADIGVAMGQRGTDAARQMADMVLRDDRFSTIVAAVRQGRIIFANIRKSVIFMLCTNLAEILAVTLASVAQAPIPLRPLQILFLNVVTDVFPALALSVGEGSRDVMDRPTRDPEEHLLTRYHWRVIGGWSVIVGGCVLAALSVAIQGLGLDEPQAVTISFLTLGFAKLGFVFNLRDRGTPIWNNDVVRNGWVWAAIALCTALLLATVYWSLMSVVLDTDDPGAHGWLLILGMGLIPVLLGLVVPGIRFYKVHK